MRYSSHVKPISYLKANAAEVLTHIAEQREPLIITQNGEAKAVLQDVVSFEETRRPWPCSRSWPLVTRTWRPGGLRL